MTSPCCTPLPSLLHPGYGCVADNSTRRAPLVDASPTALGACCSGIEEIGVQIEDPFGILPLEVISNKAKADMIELVNREHEVKAVASVRDGPAQEEANFATFELERRHAKAVW
jgi:hypothetical protein